MQSWTTTKLQRIAGKCFFFRFSLVVAVKEKRITIRKEKKKKILLWWHSDLNSILIFTHFVQCPK